MYAAIISQLQHCPAVNRDNALTPFTASESERRDKSKKRLLRGCNMPMVKVCEFPSGAALPQRNARMTKFFYGTARGVRCGRAT
jgi:hypothetical protein